SPPAAASFASRPRIFVSRRSLLARARSVGEWDPRRGVGVRRATREPSREALHERPELEPPRPGRFGVGPREVPERARAEAERRLSGATLRLQARCRALDEPGEQRGLALVARRAPCRLPGLVRLPIIAVIVELHAPLERLREGNRRAPEGVTARIARRVRMLPRHERVRRKGALGGAP